MAKELHTDILMQGAREWSPAAQLVSFDKRAVAYANSRESSAVSNSRYALVNEARPPEHSRPGGAIRQSY